MSFSRDSIDHLREEAQIPGLSMAIITPEETTYIQSGVSDMDSQKSVDTETVFEACSLSKPVFAYLVVKLIKEGILPENFLDEPFSVGAKEITARMALSHQTGLPNEGPPEFDFDPGTAFSYSGEGYFALQQEVKKRTGRSLESLSSEYIFDDLGMTHSSFVRPSENIAVNHDELMNTQKPWIKNDNAAGSLHTTASDYALFIEACLKDEKLVKLLFSPQVIDMLHKDKVALEKKVDNETLATINWGLGWGMQQTEEGVMAFHWGHSVNSRAFVAINLNTKSAVVYFANSENGLDITHDIVQSIGNLDQGLEFLAKKYDYRQHGTSAWDERHAEVQRKYDEWLDHVNNPAVISTDHLKKCEGQYGPVKIELENNKLHFKLGDHNYELIPISDTRFVLPIWDSSLPFQLEFDTNTQKMRSTFKNFERMDDRQSSTNVIGNLLSISPETMTQPEQPVEAKTIQQVEKREDAAQPQLDQHVGDDNSPKFN